MKTPMNTVRCYDRFAALKRWALLSMLLTGAAAAVLIATPAAAAPTVHQLPRVVVTGKSQATRAAEVQARQVVTLPRVVVVAERRGGLQRVSLVAARSSEF